MPFKIGDWIICIRPLETYKGGFLKEGQAYKVCGPYKEDEEWPMLKNGQRYNNDRFILGKSLTKLEKVIYNINEEEV